MSIKKTEELENAGQSRRNFLRAGLGGATVAAATAGVAIAPAKASESDAEKKKVRYQETAHVKKFYQTNRY
ncbi:MAG: formate dehydrogenase [Rhabdaerophilum sp.]